MPRPALRVRARTPLHLESLERRLTPASFAWNDSYPTGANPRSAATGDFDGDGDLDLVVISATQGVNFFLNDGTGKMTQSNFWGGGGETVRTADLNGDGKLDVVMAANFGNSMTYYLGNGDGTFQAPVGKALAYHAQSIVATDLNGDGRTDIAIADDTGAAVFLNDGTAAMYGSEVRYSPGAGANAVAIAAADLTGDGRPDLILGELAVHKLSILINNGNGTFTPGQRYDTADSTYDVEVADFNGDGKLDAVISSSNFGGISVFLGSGGGAFGAPNSYSTGFVRSGRLDSGDVDGDGILDLAIQGALSFSTAIDKVMIGTGTGAFVAGVDVNLAAGPTDAVLADVSGDGLPDLIGPGSSSPGSVGVAMNTSMNIASFKVTAVPSTVAGAGFDVSVKAQDASNATLKIYDGTVHFTSTDPLASAGNGLPANYQFTAGDKGQHTFQNVVLKTAGRGRSPSPISPTPPPLGPRMFLSARRLRRASCFRTSPEPWRRARRTR